MSWLTVFLAGVLAVLARRAAWNRNELLAGLGLIVGVLGLGFSYGHFRLQELATNREQEISTAPVRMALIQGNIAQDLKWDPVRQEEWLRRYLDLSSQLGQPADLVIWPETAAAFFLQASPKELGRIADLSRRLGASILTGAPMADQDESKEWQFYNSMVMIGALEKGNFRQRYDKHHLVPFGPNQTKTPTKPPGATGLSPKDATKWRFQKSSGEDWDLVALPTLTGRQQKTPAGYLYSQQEAA
ncbi:MAG: hypothetical protein HQL93_12855 [Magnetococcales bacterium]|nr:hypothetical protein [Magnetococcales bacterium]